MKKFNAILLFLFLTVLSLTWHFRDNFFTFYQNPSENIAQIRDIDLKKTIEDIKENGLTSKPLKVAGTQNQTIFTREKIIAQTNIARFNNGMLPPLIENNVLNEVALKKVQNMFAEQYFEHISPRGVGPGDLAKSEGYQYILQGENLILGNFKDEKDILDLWMKSPSHRANILHDRYTEIGVAIVKGEFEGETVWIGVQEFGLPLSGCPIVDALLKNNIETNKTSLQELSVGIDQQKIEIEKTSPGSDNYNTLIQAYNLAAEKYNQLNQATKKMVAEYNAQIDAFNMCVNKR